jgi:hypothetical protein
MEVSTCRDDDIDMIGHRADPWRQPLIVLNSISARCGLNAQDGS